MNIYDVYRHPKTKKYQAVKQGFCWPVFFFLPLWAFSRRLYLLGMVLSVLVIFVLAAEVMINPQGFWMEKAVSLSQVACYALIAWFANDVRRFCLGLKKFEKKSSATAKWPSHAIRQHIDGLAISKELKEVID